MAVLLEGAGKAPAGFVPHLIEENKEKFLVQGGKL